MFVIAILIFLSLTLALGFLWCFVWAVRSGQYEDTLTPSMRILTDDTTGPQGHATQTNPINRTPPS